MIQNHQQQQHMNYMDDNINIQDYNNVNSRKVNLAPGNMMQANIELPNGNSRSVNLTAQNSHNNANNANTGGHGSRISKTSLDQNQF